MMTSESMAGRVVGTSPIGPDDRDVHDGWWIAFPAWSKAAAKRVVMRRTLEWRSWNDGLADL